MNKVEEKAWKIAFETYTTGTLPDGFEEMDDSEMMQYLNKYKWEPFEYFPTNDLLDLIDTLAYSIKKEFGA